jgi:hypothetical protein
MDIRDSRSASARSMRRARVIGIRHVVLAVGMSFVALDTAAVAAAASSCGSPAAAAAQRIALQPGQEITLQLDTTTHGVLIEEYGSDLAYGLGQDDALREIEIKPPRLGVIALAAGTAVVKLRLRESHGPSFVVVRSDCLTTDQIEFFQRLEAFYRDRLNAGAEAAVGALAELDAWLLREARPWQRAWLLHARANAFSSAGRSVEASAAFEAAHHAWMTADDPARASVARFAAAEDDSRAGNTEVAAARLATAIPEFAALGLRYFELRSRASLCFIQNRLGNVQVSIQCDTPVADGFRAAGEFNEAGARDISLANQWSKLGKLDIVRDRLLAIDANANVLSPMLRHRLSVAFSNYYLLTGDFAAAAREVAEAVEHLGPLGTPQDHAVIDLRLARLAGLAGAHAEELRLAERALERLRETSVAEHLASAAIRAAQAHRALGQFDRVATYLDRAEPLCRQIGKADCLELIALQRIELDLSRADAEAAQARLAALPALGLARSRTHRDILQARALLLGGAASDALARLSAVSTTGLDLDMVIDLTLAKAEALADTGAPDLARSALLHRLQQLTSAASKWPSSSLRLSLRAHAARLQSALIDAISIDADGSLGEVQLDALFATITASAELDAAPSENASDELPDDVRQALSDAILADRPADPKAAQEAVDPRVIFMALLSLGGESAARAAAARTAWSGMPTQDASDVLLLPLAGASRFLLLAVAGERVAVCADLPRAEFDAIAARFETVLAGRDVALAQAGADAQRLYDAVAVCRAGSRMSRWSVLASTTAPALPWSWIAARAESVDQAEPAVTILFDLPTSAASPLDLAAQGTVVSLDLPGSDRLPFAQAEQARVTATISANGMDTQSVPAGNQDAASLLRLLSAQDQWIHVIGHGNSPDYGPLYAGLWFRGRDRAALLTYPDIGSHASRAALVVLSACGAGPSDLSPNAVNLLLAEAFITAGARHVVAASNALSDSAAPFWTGVFYESLATSHDPAIALRDARRALRGAPHFRHPKYWGGLDHYGSQDDRNQSVALAVKLLSVVNR